MDVEWSSLSLTADSPRGLEAMSPRFGPSCFPLRGRSATALRHLALSLSQALLHLALSHPQVPPELFTWYNIRQ